MANISSLSGALTSLSGTVTDISNTVNTLSGQTANNTSNISTLSGQIITLNSQMSTLSGQIASLAGQAHDAITLGLANGLTLSGQQISLALANSTVTGALSIADWNTFNNKQNALSAGAGISIVGNTISATDDDSNNWLLGGNTSGNQALGSNDSILPFLSS
jgi:hypothetical protein